MAHPNPLGIKDRQVGDKAFLGAVTQGPKAVQKAFMTSMRTYQKDPTLGNRSAFGRLYGLAERAGYPVDDWKATKRPVERAVDGVETVRDKMKKKAYDARTSPPKAAPPSARVVVEHRKAKGERTRDALIAGGLVAGGVGGALLGGRALVRHAGKVLRKEMARGTAAGIRQGAHHARAPLAKSMAEGVREGGRGAFWRLFSLKKKAGEGGTMIACTVKPQMYRDDQKSSPGAAVKPKGQQAVLSDAVSPATTSKQGMEALVSAALKGFGRA